MNLSCCASFASLAVVYRLSAQVCVIGDAVHMEEAKALGLDCMDIEDLKKINKNKKIVKKLARK